MSPSAVEQAREAFAAERLQPPPIPDDFARELRKTVEWCFSTRAIDPGALYMFDEYLAEALRGAAPDYVAFCHAGHGVNSYAITYHLVDGPLVLLVQSPYGGAYMGQREHAGVVEQFRRCEALVDSMTRARARRLDARPGRLCVVESTLRDLFAWGWVAEPMRDPAAVQEWLRAQATVPSGGPLAPPEWPTAAARAWLERQATDTPAGER
jgi:hypothetical protein